MKKTKQIRIKAQESFELKTGKINIVFRLLIFSILLSPTCLTAQLHDPGPLTLLHSEGYSCYSGKTSYGDAIAFLSLSRESILFSTEKDLYKSTDGGQSWNLLSGSNVSASQPIFPENPKTGYRIDPYSKSISHTADGGLSWKQLPGTPGNKIFTCMSFLNNNCGLACSRDFLNRKLEIFKTEDAGQSWVQVFESNAEAENALFEMQYLNSGLVFACGTQGQVLTSEDGGNSWTVFMSPKRQSEVVHFLSLDYLFDYRNVDPPAQEQLSANKEQAHLN